MINLAFILERIDQDPNTQCWNWIRSRTTAGYGDFRYKQQHYYAHRVSYQLAHGPIPEGMEVRHKCDNPSCCNPMHLELGTHWDNMNDSALRGRQSRGERHATKLCEADIAMILVDTSTQAEIAKKYGISRSYVGMIKQGKRWKV